MSDNEIAHCGLELGCCSRQIPYDMAAHDKMMFEDGYRQGRADAIDEFVNITFESLERTKPNNATEFPIVNVEFMKNWLVSIAEILNIAEVLKGAEE